MVLASIFGFIHVAGSSASDLNSRPSSARYERGGGHANCCRECLCQVVDMDVRDCNRRDSSRDFGLPCFYRDSIRTDGSPTIFCFEC